MIIHDCSSGDVRLYVDNKEPGGAARAAGGWESSRCAYRPDLHQLTSVCSPVSFNGGCQLADLSSRPLPPPLLLSTHYWPSLSAVEALCRSAEGVSSFLGIYEKQVNLTI